MGEQPVSLGLFFLFLVVTLNIRRRRRLQRRNGRRVGNGVRKGRELDSLLPYQKIKKKKDAKRRRHTLFYSVLSTTCLFVRCVAVFGSLFYVVARKCLRGPKRQRRSFNRESSRLGFCARNLDTKKKLSGQSCLLSFYCLKDGPPSYDVLHSGKDASAELHPVLAQ